MKNVYQRLGNLSAGLDASDCRTLHLGMRGGEFCSDPLQVLQRFTHVVAD
jgi:hypothetical protein